MAVHKIKRGLDLPIQGVPEARVEEASAPRHVALLGDDYVGMKPTMLVSAGDAVRRGQPIFEDKKTPGVVFTAPASGTVVAVHRGHRRAFQSLVIELSDEERGLGAAAPGDAVSFEAFDGSQPAQWTAEGVRALLLESGLWTALRSRPFGRVPNPSATPNSIFVTAMDTQPLAPPVSAVLDGREEDFQRGLEVLGHLTEGAIYLCRGPQDELPAVDGAAGGRVRTETFAGPHPAGLPGTHIHFLDPVSRAKEVWHLGVQDVLAIGHLFATGELDVRRLVSLGGPVATSPRLLRTRVGASLDDLTAGELQEGENRLISGSVFGGRTASGEVVGYLGRFHQQVTVLAEGRERKFLGWLTPGGDRFSLTRAFTSALSGGGNRFAFNTSTNGSPRAIVPIGLFEKVMPLDILPTFLLKALVVQDIEYAETLGVLELSEEDLALCTFVSPGKTEFGTYLRDALTTIEKEG
ncbi:MAG: Na(+)-translocating NADH-quinone reductase subunit A [Acidobacteriota bacterium]